MQLHQYHTYIANYSRKQSCSSLVIVERRSHNFGTNGPGHAIADKLVVCRPTIQMPWLTPGICLLRVTALTTGMQYIVTTRIVQ
jgi:hypothetical protein